MKAKTGTGRADTKLATTKMATMKVVPAKHFPTSKAPEAATATTRLNLSVTDILKPSLFLRPAYLAPSDTLGHLPLLFWLVETIRPRCAVTLSLGRGLAHFAVCQAVDRLGLSTRCYGLGPALDEAVHKYNEQHYLTFSHLTTTALATATSPAEAGEIDLLIIDAIVDKVLAARIEREWRPRLSRRGLILFTHTPISRFVENKLSAHGDLFSLGAPMPATLFLDSGQTTDSLRRLAALSQDSAGYILIHSLFSRLGEACLLAGRMQEQTEEGLKKAEARIAELIAEKAVLLSIVSETRLELEADLQRQTATLREREKDIAILGDLLHARDQADQQISKQTSANVHQPLSTDRINDIMPRLQVRRAQVQAALRAFRFGKTYRSVQAAFAQQTELVSGSQFFDEAWYRQTYPDLRRVKDVCGHFVRYGTFEGRHPGPAFDTLHYYADYPEVAEAGMCALVHYIAHGQSEGRAIHPASPR